jgi:hypothetical protein
VPRTPVQNLGIAFAALSSAVALGSSIYLAASGTQPGAPFVFVVGAALALCATLYLLARSAMSVIIEPQADEVRVATGRRRKELEREKQLLLKALKELAFDHEMHKISDADYEDITGQYRARAVRIMRQLDEGATAYRKQIEDELRARRDKTEKKSDGAKGEPAAAPEAKKDDRRACVHCSTPNEHDAVFCKKCGKHVVEEAAQQ